MSTGKQWPCSEVSAQDGTDASVSRGWNSPIPHCWVLDGPCYTTGSSTMGIMWRHIADVNPDQLFDLLERVA